MSFVMWFIVSMYLSNIAGAYRVLVFAILQILCAVGFVYEVLLIMESQELINGSPMTFSEAARFALTNNLLPSLQQEDKLAPLKSDDQTDDLKKKESTDASVCSKEEEEKSSSVEEIKRIASTPRLGVKSMSLDTDAAGLSSAMRKRPASSKQSRARARNRYLLGKLKAELRGSFDMQDDEELVDTDKYMYGAVYACIGMLLWKHWWIVHILVIPLAYYIVKQLGNYFGFWDMIYKYYDWVLQAVKSWCLERHQALLPSNIRGLYKVSIIVDEKVRSILKSSVDAVATTAVIFGLIIFITFTSIFITIQVKQ